MGTKIAKKLSWRNPSRRPEALILAKNSPTLRAEMFGDSESCGSLGLHSHSRCRWLSRDCRKLWVSSRGLCCFVPVAARWRWRFEVAEQVGFLGFTDIPPRGWRISERCHDVRRCSEIGAGALLLCGLSSSRGLQGMAFVFS